VFAGRCSASWQPCRVRVVPTAGWLECVLRLIAVSTSANLEPASKVPRRSGTRGALARGASRAGGAARPDEGLPAPPATDSVARARLAGRLHRRISTRRSRGGREPRLSLCSRADHSGSGARPSHGHARSARLRVAAFAREAECPRSGAVSRAAQNQTPNPASSISRGAG